MKRVVSISLGSSRRDKQVTAELLGETFQIARIGTDGDPAKFKELVEKFDGTVDAITLGGLDRWLWSEGRRYEFRTTRRLIAGVKKTPVLDGSGLKNTLEREAVRWLARNHVVDFRRSNTLMVCATDRFGMAEALVEQGGPVIFGDLMFNLGLPTPLRSWRAFRRLARILLPIITQVPITWLYPTGESQNAITPKWGTYYRWADVIAGDLLLIRRYLPEPDPADPPLAGAVILTNTTTESDIEELRRRGARLLVTTTPRFEGRSFGTNVMEGVLVAARGGKTLSPPEYLETLKRLGWTPAIQSLQEQTKEAG
jgi:hypothetical protein